MNKNSEKDHTVGLQIHPYKPKLRTWATGRRGGSPLDPVPEVRDRGAPPRGVDVKQPLRSPPPGAGEPIWASRIPDPGIPGIPIPRSRRTLRFRRGPVPGPREGSPGPARMAGIPDLPIPDRGSGPGSPQGFYINPSRRPPRKPPGSREGLPGSPGVPEGSPEIPTPPGPGSRRALFPPPPAGIPRGPGARG